MSEAHSSGYWQDLVFLQALGRRLSLTVLLSDSHEGGYIIAARFISPGVSPSRQESLGGHLRKLPTPNNLCLSHMQNTPSQDLQKSYCMYYSISLQSRILSFNKVLGIGEAPWVGYSSLHVYSSKGISVHF